MVNVGRPSNACHACRQRRLKCDLMRPECDKCRRKGQLCPGYRDGLSLRFRTKTLCSFQSGAKQSHRRIPNQAAISNPSMNINRPETVVGQQKHYLGQYDCLAKRSSPLIYPLAELWDDQCLLFTVNHLKLSFGICTRMFHSLARMIFDAAEESALYQTCNAIGRAYITKQNPSREAMHNQTRQYATALRAVNFAIQDPQQCKCPKTLLCVWLLGMYELVSASRGCFVSKAASSEWDIHSQGLMQLLRLQSPNCFTTQDGRNLFWVVFNTVQIQAIRTGQDCPSHALTWIHELSQYCNPSEYSALRAGVYSYNCTRICSRIRRLVDAGDAEELLSCSPCILQEIEDVEETICTLPPAEHGTSCVIESRLASYAGPDTRDPSYIGDYAYQNNFRMRLFYHILEFLNYACTAPSCTPQQKQLFARFQRVYIGQFRTLANDVLFALGVTPITDSLAHIDQHVRTRLLLKYGPVTEHQNIILAENLLMGCD